MDTGKGYFDIVDRETISKLTEKLSTIPEQEKLQNRLFYVGEIVSVKDSKFIIQKISKKRLILKLLKD